MSSHSHFIPARRGGIPALADIVSAVSTWVRQCADRAAQRRALARLDDRLLRDIGLTRLDVREECDKWFWRR
jgi:uncharacterized protein YjiS (DUF1127 family)